MKSIFKAPNLLYRLSYIYIALPICIFLLGWLKPYISIPLTLIVTIALFLCLKKTPLPDWQITWNQKTIETFIFAAIIIAFWVYLSGIGGLAFQTSDHTCRNTIFELLVTEKWPVAISGRELIYYIGFWMPAAVVGKLFGITIGYYFQAIWAFLGLFIFFYLLCHHFKEVKLWYLIVFIMFSGLDILGCAILKFDPSSFMYFTEGESIYAIGSVTHLEWWSGFQFSSFTTQLFWVFNQALPSWIIILLISQQKSNRNIIFLLGCTLLSSTFPFIGMLPFIVYWMVSRKYGDTFKGWIKNFIKDTFTFENVLGGGIAGIISFLYLRGNQSSQLQSSNVSSHNTKTFLMVCIIFILIEVGLYYIAIYKYNKRNPLYYISFIWLCLCPLTAVGSGQDFCMRASIPALVLLFIMVADTLRSTYSDKCWKIFIPLLVLLCIGSVTPLHEINRSIRYTVQDYYTQSSPMAENVSVDDIMYGANFSGDCTNDFFYQYFCK